MNFQEYFYKYYDYLSYKLKPQSIKSIFSRFNNYILPYFKKYNIEDITELDYLNWKKYIETLNFKYSYKKSLHYAFVSFYNYLDLFYNYKCNIPKRVGGFINNDIPTEYSIWSYNEFNKFINYFTDSDYIYKVFFTFLFSTGCRLGESLALTFNDLNNNTLFINKTISKELYDGSKKITTPKSRSSIRYIKIDDYLLSMILDLKKYYCVSDNFNLDFYIFGGRDSLSVSNIKRRLNKYCNLANLKRIRLHDFRHSHATFLLKNNVPIIEVSRRLGHSDINMTIKTYSHLSNEYEKKVLDTFNSLYKNL